MIAKIIPRKHGPGSFRDSVNYNLGLSRNDTDKVEYVNTLDIFEPSVAIREMEALALENTRSKDPVFNCILSWRENEIPSHEQADEAVSIVLKELGLEGCQAHYALHRNTRNLHLHLCVNRIDPETYRARDPAHGWTKKALEKAARKIELAQGWEIERSGRYVVTPDGEIIEKPDGRGEGVKLSQTARDIEAHTAAKSAERIAQEVAAPIIRSAKSWDGLHEGLAERGISFERKGSGTILRIGETAVKASRAGRDISLSKLEKRLGAFRERDVSVPALQPEPVERVEKSPKVKNAWARYQEAKAGYFKAKKDAFSELQKRHREERKSMFESQRAERSALFAVSWGGKGLELNRHRSVMAAKQQSEKLELRDRQKAEREGLKKHFPLRFPSFKAWLSLDANPELFALFRYPGRPVLLCAGDDTRLPGKRAFDIRDYSPVSRGKSGGVRYFRNGGTAADFIDYGKTIVFAAKYDETSVTAALQLAAQKWGGVQINGSEEYRRLCVRLAAKHGVKVVNPELKRDYDATREEFCRSAERSNRGWSR
ncbi:MAG: relaxase/mobilization nuclease domain-containing protein [Synergistaceae bacterium]|nr:relaxase/mobilization nuclease domain-containing protein [Synergistaceae bacterium]